MLGVNLLKARGDSRAKTKKLIPGVCIRPGVFQCRGNTKPQPDPHSISTPHTAQQGSPAPTPLPKPAAIPTSRNREMSLLSLTLMATMFSNIQKKGRSSPALGRA